MALSEVLKGPTSVYGQVTRGVLILPDNYLNLNRIMAHNIKLGQGAEQNMKTKERGSNRRVDNIAQ
jgi:hypothetical protein